MAGPLDVVMICTKCGALAPYTPPDINNPWGTWHWHQPCTRCGAEQWAAHDVCRDWKSGRRLDPEQTGNFGKPK